MISGVMTLRNAVKFGYPYEVALRSLRSLCDEIVVAVDPTSEDDTVACVRALDVVDRVVESPWDMTYDPKRRNEIAVQTDVAVAAATGDWVFSLQADEVLHEAEIPVIRAAVTRAISEGASGIELLRLYFYGDLEHVRTDWTLYLTRLFQRGRWTANSDAMSCNPVVAGERCLRSAAHIFHYSRAGNAQVIADRVRNLDRFFHPPTAFSDEPPAPYDFGTLRKLDTYAKGPTQGQGANEPDPHGQLAAYDIALHPAAALRFFDTRPL